MNSNYNNTYNPLTLADIFLDVLEQMSKDEKHKAYVRKVRTLMDVPECSEFLSRTLINAMGYPTPISESTVDKAVNCLIHFHEGNIEECKDLTKAQKEFQKVMMKEFMNQYCKTIKTFIASKNLLMK